MITTRVKQWFVALLGSAICLTMLWLGLWQMHAFEGKEDASAQARAAQPPVALLDLVASDGSVEDVYGRQVWVQGEYLSEQQALVLSPSGGYRVATALLLADGRVLTVVRGTVNTPEAPAPPSGPVEVTGVFLPTEAPPEGEVPDCCLGSLRLGTLAQQWPQQLLPGFVTLPPGDSASQGLAAATVTLPTGQGSLQNLGYALQWWAFAGFGAFMTIRFVRALGSGSGMGTLSEEELT